MEGAGSERGEGWRGGWGGRGSVGLAACRPGGGGQGSLEPIASDRWAGNSMKSCENRRNMKETY